MNLFVIYIIGQSCTIFCGTKFCVFLTPKKDKKKVGKNINFIIIMMS